MHAVVAAERCELEAHVVSVAQDVISSTSVLVSTVGSLLRPSALREIGGGENRQMSFILCDEGTRTSKFEFDMLVAAITKFVDTNTSLGILGDSCQVKTAMRTLTCTNSLHTGCKMGLSLVNWIVDLLISEDPRPHDFVNRVDLLNRHQYSQRCRVLACDAVNKLAPLCLPGNARFWGTYVDSTKVWASLRPKDQMAPFERFLTSKTHELVSIQCKQMQNACGFIGSSHYDLDVALYAAMAAVLVCAAANTAKILRSYAVERSFRQLRRCECLEKWMCPGYDCCRI